MPPPPPPPRDVYVLTHEVGDHYSQPRTTVVGVVASRTTALRAAVAAAHAHSRWGGDWTDPDPFAMHTVATAEGQVTDSATLVNVTDHVGDFFLVRVSAVRVDAAVSRRARPADAGVGGLPAAATGTVYVLTREEGDAYSPPASRVAAVVTSPAAAVAAAKAAMAASPYVGGFWDDPDCPAARVKPTPRRVRDGGTLARADGGNGIVARVWVQVCTPAAGAATAGSAGRLGRWAAAPAPGAAAAALNAHLSGTSSPGGSPASSASAGSSSPSSSGAAPWGGV